MKAIRPDDYQCTHRADGCFDLPTKIIDDPEYGLVIESTWELNGDELMAILETKRIRLKVVGGQPPVMLEVVEPEPEDNRWA